MNRKSFLKVAGASLAVMPLVPVYGHSKTSFGDDQLDRALVKEFVGKSHSDPDRVKELLEEHPTLLNAAHDWKFGDFETGLGAASHVGNKELVKYFLEKGAQANLFTMALFGRLDIIKPILDFEPKLLHAKGPHGFTLLHHAKHGGDEAKELIVYLESLGAKELKIDLY